MVVDGLPDFLACPDHCQSSHLYYAFQVDIYQSLVANVSGLALLAAHLVGRPYLFQKKPSVVCSLLRLRSKQGREDSIEKNELLILVSLQPRGVGLHKRWINGEKEQ